MHIQRILTNHLINHWLFGLKMTILAICVFTLVSGHYPPVFAQRTTHYQIETVPVITTEDAMQDDHISAINKHLQSTDDAVKSMQDSLTNVASDMASQKGEERGIGVILTILTGGGLFLQIKRKQI